MLILDQYFLHHRRSVPNKTLEGIGDRPAAVSSLLSRTIVLIEKAGGNAKERKVSRWIAANERVFWGWFFLLFASIFFVAFLYAAILSKLLPPSNNHLLSAIQKDRYYCFLVPLTLPVIVVAVYFHCLRNV